MTSPLKSLIDHIFASKDESWQFRLTKNWESIIGSLHKHMRLERIENETVFLGVYDVHWMQELYMLSKTIVRTINKGLGQNCVQSVRFRLVQRTIALKEELPKNTVKTAAIRPLSRKEQHALDAIGDEHLRSALRDFLLKTNGI